MEDERLLLGHPDLAPEAVAEWKALGVDVVRIHAQWWNIAPKRKPAGFHASDPADPSDSAKITDRTLSASSGSKYSRVEASKSVETVSGFELTMTALHPARRSTSAAWTAQ